MPTLLILVLHSAQVASGEEVINRREQARRMLVATPESIYVHYCAHCHGDDGTGGGRLWPTELSVKPADLTALGTNEDYLIEAIREGSAVHGKSNLCPPWGRTIAPPNITRLARYIVSLGSDTPPPSEHTSAPPRLVEEPFPWLLGALLVVESVVLLWMLRAREKVSNVVRYPSPSGEKEASA